MKSLQIRSTKRNSQNIRLNRRQQSLNSSNDKVPIRTAFLNIGCYS